MGRAKHRQSGNFALIPDEVLRSEAWRTLNHSPRSTLVVVAAQFHGGRNGCLLLTPTVCKNYGLDYCQALRDVRVLEEQGLIEKTCQGGRRPQPPSQYALQWRRITHRNNGPLDRKEAAPNGWATWTPENLTQRSAQPDTAHSAVSGPRNTALSADAPPLNTALSADLLESGSGGKR